MTRRLLAIVLIGWPLVVGGAYVLAQETSKPPALTEVQKLTIQNLAARMENAQLRAQLAQAEFDKARIEIATLMQSLQVTGYDLDLNTWSYVKKPEKKE